MQEAGAKIKDLFDFVLSELKVGVSIEELDLEVGNLIEKNGCKSALKMTGFPSFMSFSFNTEVVQGLPAGKTVSAGDLISIDTTLSYKGIFVDKAISVVIPPAHFEKEYIVSAVNQCFAGALEATRPGATTKELGLAIQRQSEFLKVIPCKELCGHGIGVEYHMPPQILNYYREAEPDIYLKEGQFICLEPIVFYGSSYTLDSNKHTFFSKCLSAHREETIMVTETGAEILTC
jgi:methionyl aminopeptidase